jgi:lipopolysaccharide transport system ATP-binding protein
MSDIAVKLENTSKFYKLYKEPKDRLKEALHPLGKRYHQEFYALRDINLEVRKGEILGIVGRNGAGKSTLLKLITGVIQPSSGRLRITGHISALLDLSSGFNPDFSGLQNIYFSGTMMGFSRKEMKEKVDDIIDFADIGDFIHQPLNTYSKGMQARLGFALAINMNPEILILDEVLSVGDELFRRKCYARMEEFFESGCTIFFASHSLPSINEICTRTIFLDRGELILEGSPKMVTMYYQKYLFSEVEYAQKLRNEIIELNKNEELKKKYEVECVEDKEDQENKSEKVGPQEIKEAESKVKQKPFFIPNFEPKTTISHENNKVQIEDVHIETLSKERVNALLMNDIYIVSYKVTFQLEMERVKFTALFRTEKGLTISGIRIPKEINNSTSAVKRGETYLIQSKFKCSLLPGIYYLSVSVTTTNNEKKSPVGGISDAAVFKVQEEKKMHYWGIVNLEQKGEIQKLDYGSN